jgi:hypothetical protein
VLSSRGAAAGRKGRGDALGESGRVCPRVGGWLSANKRIFFRIRKAEISFSRRSGGLWAGLARKYSFWRTLARKISNHANVILLLYTSFIFTSESGFYLSGMWPCPISVWWSASVSSVGAASLADLYYKLVSHVTYLLLVILVKYVGSVC